MKKTIILLSFLLFAGSNAAAQDFSAHAKAEMAKNNYAPAIDELTTLLQTYPDNETLLMYRSNFYTRTGENDKAIADANKVLSKNPKNVNALISLGTAETALGKNQESIDHFTQALTAQPNFKPALIMRSKAYFKMKQPEKSLADLNAVIKDDPKNMEAYVYRGQLYTAMQKYDLARSDYQYILKNAVAGDRYHAAATQKMSDLDTAEQKARTTQETKKESDDYADKISGQITSMSKDIRETTERLTKMINSYTAELNSFVVKNEAIPKSDWEGKAKLFEEINPRIKQYIANLKKERTKIAGNDLYKSDVGKIDDIIKALGTVIDLTSPYAARRQQYVAEVNKYNEELTTTFKEMLAAQKSSNQPEFERKKILAVGKATNILLTVKNAREDLKKIDSAKFSREDDEKSAAVLTDYTKSLATVNSVKY